MQLSQPTSTEQRVQDLLRNVRASVDKVWMRLSDSGVPEYEVRVRRFRFAVRVDIPPPPLSPAPLSLVFVTRL